MSRDSPPPEWIDWRTQAFDPDGAFRDVFVRETTIDDWDRVLRALPGAYSAGLWEMEEGKELGVERPYPLSAATEVGLMECGNLGRFLAVAVGGTEYHTKFFEEHLIVFNKDPRYIETWGDVAHCFEFMAWLERLLDKPVFLSYEGSHETPIAECERATGRIIRHKGWELNP